MFCTPPNIAGVDENSSEQFSKCMSFLQNVAIKKLNTSPWARCAKVIDDPRAPESSTGTLAYSWATNALAWASLPFQRQGR